ncbi:ATP-binding protein [Azospirillum sp. TSO35-2]|uniref:ATP-binding protein n=1 Tax=Azospirillum sp. TSO35-2 TaxID=716796 RepID=UPI000D6133E7|nr:ATP-binding protein [Azospirillum sp. TSO35-2]PWC33359.1 hypothetical protein TSO352_23030 [Azospirillum sp. TSO35-2]
MRRPQDLERQISVAMIGVAMAGLLSSLVSFYIVYGLIHVFAPHYFPDADVLVPTVFDLASLLLAGVLGLAVAAFVSVVLARRLARPLRTVAQAAKQIAQGNLAARATPDAYAPEEAATLITDFNDMAGRLEATAQRMVTWNAQVAHELRTPITILTGRLQGVVDGVFAADEKLIQGLLTQVTVLRRLVEDLRVVSLADSGRLVLQLGEVSLADEVSALVEFVAPDLEAAGFTPRLSLEAGTATVDIVRIRQALLALIENARRHADPGSLSIGLRFSGEAIAIEVIDCGPGLPPEFASQAFNEFARAGATQRSGRPGSGLGLSVVRAVARAHGGEARYHREDGGSAFTLVLPRHARRAGSPSP